MSERGQETDEERPRREERVELKGEGKRRGGVYQGWRACVFVPNECVHRVCRSIGKCGSA